MSASARPRLLQHLLALPYFVYGGFILPLGVEAARMVARGRVRFQAAHVVGLFVVAYLIVSAWIVRPLYNVVGPIPLGQFIRWHVREVVPIVAIFLAAVPRPVSRIDAYLLALLRVGALVGFLGLVDYLFFVSTGAVPFHTIRLEVVDHFFTAWLDAHNAAGGLYAALAAISLWWFLTRRVRLWVLLGLLAGLGLTGSRSGYLGFAVVAVVFLFRRVRGPRGRAVLVLAGLVVVAVAVRAPASHRVEQGLRVSTPLAEDRFKLWHQAWEAFHRDPFVGVGWGNYAYYDKHLYRSNEPTTHAHNSYLEILAELGLVGFFLLGAFMVAIVGPLWKRRRYELLGALGAIAMSSITEHNFGAPTITAPIFLVIGMVLAAEEGTPAAAVLDRPAAVPATVPN